MPKFPRSWEFWIGEGQQVDFLFERSKLELLKIEETALFKIRQGKKNDKQEKQEKI